MPSEAARDPVRSGASGIRKARVHAELTDRAFQRLRDLVHAETGIMFAERKKYFLESHGRVRLDATGCATFEDYLKIFGDPATARREMVRLIDEITVQETRFFRNQPVLETIAFRCLPAAAAELAGRGPVRIVSAGCATGEEAYSLAMAASEASPRGDIGGVRVDGIDICERAISVAEQRVWDEYSLRGVSPHRVNLFFSVSGREVRLGREWDSRLAAVTRFRVCNLLSRAGLADLAGSDIAVCCNVLPYFSDEARAATVRNLCGVLRPGGFLLLSQGERLVDPPAGMTEEQFPKVVAYRKQHNG